MDDARAGYRSRKGFEEHCLIQLSGNHSYITIPWYASPIVFSVGRDQSRTTFFEILSSWSGGKWATHNDGVDDL